MSDVTSFEVTGDWRHIVDDGMVDGDNLPDEVPLTGKVVFKPVYPTVATAGVPVTAYTLGPVTALIAGGVLTDLQGRPGQRLAGKVGEHTVRWSAETSLRFQEQKVDYPRVTFDLTEDVRLTGIITQAGPSLTPIVVDPRIEALAASVESVNLAVVEAEGHASTAAEQVPLAKAEADRAIGLAGAQDEHVAGVLEDPESATHAALLTVGNATYGTKAEVAAKPSKTEVAVSPSPALGGLGILRAMLALAPQRPCAVVFLGSSTTESAYSDPDNKYPNIVTAALQRAYPSDVPSFTVRMPSSTVSVVRNTAPGVHGYNGGRGGTRSDTYITASDLGNIGIIQPAIIVHAVGANDWHAGTAPATYKTQMLAALDSLDAIVDGPLVHVLVHQHSRNVTGSSYTWDQYGGVLRQIATERPDSCVFVDASETFYALGIPGTDPLGLGHADKVHLVDGGNWVLSEQVTQAVAHVGSRPPLLQFVGELPPTVVGLASSAQAETASGPVSRTFTGMALGEEDATRTIVVAVNAWAGFATGTLDAVSINGTPATVDFTAPVGTNVPVMGFARLALPTGTSADISVTVGGGAESVARWGIAVVSVTGGPIAPAGEGVSHGSTVTVSGANGGVVLAAGYRPNGSETWAGDVEPLWSQAMASPRRFIGGFSTAAGPVTATITSETYARVAAIPYRRTG